MNEHPHLRRASRTGRIDQDLVGSQHLVMFRNDSLGSFGDIRSSLEKVPVILQHLLEDEPDPFLGSAGAVLAAITSLSRPWVSNLLNRPSRITPPAARISPWTRRLSLCYLSLIVLSQDGVEGLEQILEVVAGGDADGDQGVHVGGACASRSGNCPRILDSRILVHVSRLGSFRWIPSTNSAGSRAKSSHIQYAKCSC